MEIKVIKIKEEKAELYNSLIDKYKKIEFTSPEEEQEYLNVLKNLIGDAEIEFESKAWLLSHLVATIFR